MNDRDLAPLLFRSTTPANRMPISQPVRITGLYDTAARRSIATSSAARLIERSEDPTRLRMNWWSVDSFFDTREHADAVESSRTSSILWLACKGDPAQIDVAQWWIAESCATTDRSVSLIVSANAPALQSAAGVRLKNMALRHHLQLILDPEGRSLQNARPFVVNAEEKWPRRRPTFAPRHPRQIRFWGINE